jgi:K+-sensing histidine kinase KdpD
MRLLTLRPIWLRYGLSVFFCIFAALLTLELGPRLAQTPSPLFFAAVLFSAWYGGLGPGILASIISTLLLHTLFLAPTGAPLTLLLEDAAALAVFLIVTLMTAWLTTLQQRNQLQLQQRFAQLQSLHRLTQALSQAASLEQIYDEALTNLKQTLGADRASILLYDAD